MNTGSGYYGCDIWNPPNVLGVGDSEYYGFEILTYCWFPWLGGRGSTYYGCDISNPPKNIFRVGIQNIMVVRH
jgi:hypothetical protein